MHGGDSILVGIFLQVSSCILSYTGLECHSVSTAAEHTLSYEKHCNIMSNAFIVYA